MPAKLSKNTIDSSDREAIFTKVKYRSKLHKIYNNKCFYCNIPLSKKTSTIDHIIATSKGGADTLNNMVLCCSWCNNNKGSHSIKDFLKKLQIGLKNCTNEFYISRYKNAINVCLSNPIGEMSGKEVESVKEPEIKVERIVITAFDLIQNKDFHIK